jgi:LysR family glycine cleavage system transcriptional activator
MPQRLPSLSALKTFEAAARHESFKHAAEELAVTPVAVTRQIKVLEENLGLELFTRLHRRVVLTEAGRELAADLTGAFRAVRDAVERTRVRAGRRLLRIGTDHVFAERWLAPRIATFHRQHPLIEVELAPNDDDEGRLDGVIYYGTALKAGPRLHILFSDTVFPVCSPSLRRGGRRLDRPSDLARHRLLHEGSVDWWQRWLAVAGAEEVETTSGAVFLSQGQAYDAAAAGEGVVIGDDILTSPGLIDGTLIRPFGPVFEGGSYALARRGPDGDPAMAAFLDWLTATCRAHKSEMRRRLGLDAAATGKRRSTRKSGR